MSQKSVHLVAFFLLFHVGGCATVGGWIFTYLLRERGAGPSAGYVSAGFAGGIALGRLILLPLNSLIGHKYVVIIYCTIGIGMELTVWFVPSLIANAVMVSIFGLVMGPLYPIAMNVTSGLIPQRLLAGSIGWIAAFGPAGAALFPFLMGALSSKFGVFVMQPLPMPPKFDPNDPAVAELIASFQAIGLSKPKATDAARNPKNAATLKEIVDENDLKGKGLNEKQASLVATLAIQAGNLGSTERSYVVSGVSDGKLKSVDQVTAAVKYLEAHPAPVNDEEFNKECGVGVELSSEQVGESVRSHFEAHPADGWPSLMAFINSAKSTPSLRWAPPLEVKTSVEKLFTERFGPKETGAKGKAKEPKAPTKVVAAAPSSESTATSSKSTERTVFEEGFLGKLHKPGGNPQIHPHLREQHLSTTGGKVFTRFPPEPNGYLHIGHSKAIFVNFGYAAHYGGHCYLRYDDTNPEAEEARYFESILEMVRWLGFEPYRITYSSDHFQTLHDLAVELIKRDKAYVCHCTGEEIKANRGGEERGPRKACVHRTRPIEESIAEFAGMRDGKYQPGEAILRIKQDLEDGNPQMWDLVAYRVLNAPHHRTGAKWRIYPTYDFTHCLCDSFENISHSLCTTEFITARQSYDWLCDALEVYKPRQSEYGRLNLTGTIMSKRKILKLVKEKYV
ncbi:hypothetical protein FRB90_006592, partial [Tulasnella sp. 427]